MGSQEVEKVNEIEPKKRILCVGKIIKGRMTMVIAFHRKGGNEHVTVSQSREEEGKA